MRHLLVDGELLLGGGLEVAGAALVGAPLVVRVLDVRRQVRQPREPHVADRTRGTALEVWQSSVNFVGNTLNFSD